MTRLRPALASPAALGAIACMLIALVTISLLVASLASPIAPLFQPINRLADLPPALPTRSATWAFLAAAAIFALLSFLDTLLAKRRLPQR